MAFSTTNAFCRTWRLAALLALLLGGCSFDLGSWSLGPDKEAQPKPIAQQSPEITAQNISDSRYLLDRANTFGGTHWNYPRQFTGELRYRFHF